MNQICGFKGLVKGLTTDLIQVGCRFHVDGFFGRLTAEALMNGRGPI